MALTLGRRSLSICLLRLDLLFKQLILQPVCQPLGLLLLLGDIDVSSSSATDVLGAVLHAGTQGGVGDDFGIFACSWGYFWRADVACSSTTSGVGAITVSTFNTCASDLAIDVSGVDC